MSIGCKVYVWNNYGRDLEGRKVNSGKTERSFKVNVRFFCDCLCFQLEAHILDECPATKVQCEYKNLGCEEVVRAC